MCTVIAKKGNDLIYGFNLDVDMAFWKFDVHKTRNYFAAGITVGKTTYMVHGVNKDGQFGNVPYMNGEFFPVPKGARRERIDLISDRYVRGKYDFKDLERILKTKAVVTIPEATLHSLYGDKEGNMLIVEPGYGYKKVEENYAVLSNFPVLTEWKDFSNPFLGKDRYDKALEVLKNSGDDFSAMDAMNLLNEVRQDGKWGTRISFVYSGNENAVYWCRNADFENIQIHKLG